MDLIPAIIYGAGAIVGAAMVKVIADDAKEWAPWVTRRLLDIAVQRLPESKRERYAEEWAAHLAEVPGVIGKLAVSLQFQIAAFGARELDAKARLDAWRHEQVAVIAGIQAMAAEVLASTERRKPADEADEDTLKEEHRALEGALIEVIRRCDELEARRPALGITVAGATLMAERIGASTRAKIKPIAAKARKLAHVRARRIHRTLGRVDE